MQEFLKNYIYLITLPTLLIIFILLSYIRVNNCSLKRKIINKQATIALILGLIQLGLFISDEVLSLLALAWPSTLLQDLCPAFQFASVLVFMINKEKYYKMFMPWLIFGALMTMATAKINVVHDQGGLISYLEHTVMLTQGLFTYLIVTSYNKKELISLLYPVTFLLIWIVCSGLIPWLATNDFRWAHSATALLEPSIAPGTSYEILSSLNMPYPIPTLLFYFLSLLFAYVIATSKKFLPICFAWCRGKWLNQS